MRVGTWITLGVVAALGGAAIFYALREEPPVPEKVVTTRVKRGTVVRKVRGVGHVEPVTQVKVSANISGDLIKLVVADGTLVRRGQLLAEIDPEQWAAIVRQNEAGVRSQEAAVALEVAQLTQAKAELARIESLHQKGLATEAERDRLRADASIIEARAEAARQRVLQAQALLDEARSRLVRTRVIAPIDGTVISLKKKEGEKIRGSDLAEDILLVIAPLHAMQVQIEVSEQDVVGVVVGQAAEITIDALGRTPSAGKVVEIANSAIIRNPGSEMETTSFQVKVALEKFPEKLRSGMSSSVAIITDTHENVLAVPIEAVTARLPSQLEKRAEEVRKEEKRSFFSSSTDLADRSLEIGARRERPVEVVFVAEAGKAEPRRVKTLISSESEIEIGEGLEEGTEIIIGPYKLLSRTLLPGTVIEVQASRDREEKAAEAVASE